ncbi:Co2+/Mg2+ efflux protein ApaG [Candidatus Odyssella acanthamoebae]|uniref:Protein ApaG n=1 Tax=Candidatus Odyssella acanthamoebae TaxID=91604 RepID=A0A077AX87_9PROT|nr:Co2+/Mg2+ efflux protein ApaG [Candidatus Paracaedibacter acanthamoebae]AIK97211.1 ApaG [Candidatus Paracaedibacter acanthamoebae]
MTTMVQTAPSYTQESEKIRVTVYPIYLESQSAPDENHYLWAYHVRIENLSDSPVQLKNRYWEITDSFGRTQIVKGIGVVGEQPTIQPDEIYEYTSGTPLTTPSGIMVGRYHMTRQDGELFSVDVPAFSLDSPYQPIILN